MGHEVFVSYKYSDGKVTKDHIMNAIGRSGHIYNGEKGFCKLEVADSTLKKYLSDMIYGTTVTVVVISPEVIYSNWVEWEIRYSLENHTRNGRTNSRNGIVCVIQSRDEYKYDSFYGSRIVKNSNWAFDLYGNSKKINSFYLPNIIKNNMKGTFGTLGRYIGFLDDNESNVDINDYCIVVSESTFIKNPNKYIEEAYNRSNDYDNYPSVSRL